MHFRNGELDPRPVMPRGGIETGDTECDLLPRVTPFKFKYKADAPLRVHADRTTLHVGGDCHMGRALVIDKDKAQQLSEYEHCITFARDVTQASIRCTGRRAGSSTVGMSDKIFHVQRETRLHPVEDITVGRVGKRRARCSECDVGTIEMQGPERAASEDTGDEEDPPETGSSGGDESDIPRIRVPETSTGVPMRYSAARVIATQLKEACDQAGDRCEIEGAAWDKTLFIENLLKRPWTLLKLPEDDEDNTDASTTFEHAAREIVDEIDDAPLWNIPWVLSTGTTTEGAITRNAWFSDRYGSCWGVIGEKIENDDTGLYIRDLGLCQMTGPLSTLCEELFGAKGDIENANCIASGFDCEILDMYYTPSQFSATNQAFARETIRGFYINEAGDACTGEPLRIQAAEKEASTVLAGCPATGLETMKEAIQYLRLTIYIIITVVEAVGQIFMNLIIIFIRAMQGMPVGDQIADMMYQFMLIVNLMLATLDQMMNMFMHFFAEIHTVGKYITYVFYVMCKIMATLYVVVVETIICSVFVLIREAMQFIHNVTPADLNGALDAMDEMLAAVSCKPFDFNNAASTWDNFCEMPETSQTGRETTQQAVATRCWTNPAFGDMFSDTNLLGCTAADTCLLDNHYELNTQNETIKGNLGVCERCGDVDVGSFMWFGCDMSVRKCKCAVPIQSVTWCLRNSDCYANVPCVLKASYDSQSYSSIDCLSLPCSDPVCLVDAITPDAQVVPAGTCTQMLKVPSLSKCEERDSVVPLYKNTGVCLYAQDRFTAETIAAYTSGTLQITQLAVTPCAFLSAVRGFTTCQKVQARTGTVRSLIVGSDLVGIPDLGGFQRRLLWEKPMADHSALWMSVAEQMIGDASLDWKGTGVCEELVLANAQEEKLGVMERRALRECYKWRAVVNASATLYDLWEVPDTALLHWTNTMNVFLHQLNAASVGYNRTILWQPQAYAEAVLYCLVQMEDTEQIASFARHVYAAGRRFVDTVTLMWLRMQDAREKAQNDTDAGARNHTRRRGATMRETSAGPSPFVHWSNGTHFTALAAPVVSGDGQGEFWSNIQEMVWGKAKDRFDARSQQSPVANETGTNETPKNQSAHNASRATRNRRRLLQDIDGLGNSWPVVWSDVIWNFRSEDSRTCNLFDIANKSLRLLVNSSREYFDTGYRLRNYTNYSLSATLMKRPTMSKQEFERRQSQLVDSQEGIVNCTLFSYVLDTTVDVVEAVSNITVSDVIAFFNPEEPLQQQIDEDMFTLARILNDLTHCNIKRLMLCDTHPRGLVPTIIICTALLWLLCQALFLSSGTTVLVISVVLPWTVMWYSYGYSPACFPMLHA